MLDLDFKLLFPAIAMPWLVIPVIAELLFITADLRVQQCTYRYFSGVVIAVSMCRCFSC